MPIRGMDFFRELVNFHELSVEVVFCFMPNSFFSHSTALLVDDHIPDEFTFALQTQTYKIIPDIPLHLGIFQGHNWSRDRGRISAAIQTAQWFREGITNNQNIEQIFKEIDTQALKEFNMQEGSTAAVCSFNANGSPSIHTIGNCRAIWGENQYTYDHDIENSEELKRCVHFSQSNKDKAFHVIRGISDEGVPVFKNYNPDNESDEERKHKITEVNEDPDFCGYTSLLRAFGYKMMRNLSGTLKNDIIISEVDMHILPNNWRFIFLGNPGCFEHADNNDFATIIEKCLTQGASLQEIGWRVLFYIWSLKVTNDKAFSELSDLFNRKFLLEEVSTGLQADLQVLIKRASSDGNKLPIHSSFILCKPFTKSFRLFNKERIIFLFCLLLFVTGWVLYNKLFDVGCLENIKNNFLHWKSF